MLSRGSEANHQQRTGMPPGNEDGEITVQSESPKSVRDNFVTNGEFTPPCPRTPFNTSDIKVHYSWLRSAGTLSIWPTAAWAHLLFDTQEVYSVWCELQGTTPASQLFDGQGRWLWQGVVSWLDLFDHHGFGEKHFFIHTDNCTSQNKNNCMVQYLVWMVTTSSLYVSFPLAIQSFLQVGILACSSDSTGWKWIACRQNIVEVVNFSAEYNVAQLVSHEDGTIIVINKLKKI